jgi:Swt1-like HEPN
LAAQFLESPAAKALAKFEEERQALQKSMAAMRTPWVDQLRMACSVGSFAEIQAIGGLLSAKTGFDEDVSALLRAGLGDWRDSITWPAAIFDDLTARSEFYVGLGFDTELTDFPAPAFREAVTIARLRREPPTLVDAYGAPAARAASDDEEVALVRTNEAHDWLLRLETQLRQLIDHRMTQAHGPDWPRHRLPNGLYEKWVEKKQRAEEAGGRVRPLIAYADFTDYELVLCRGDNWREIFVRYFRRPESVRETFQRLYPIRLDTMHARPITQDDELLLYVETRRLTKVIAIAMVDGPDDE